MDDYLPRILRARVYDVARESPLEPAINLSRRLNNDVWLKREDLQPVFSFKLRGAYNRMVQLSEQERERGVIAASAGNHAQGVALSASHLQCRAVIVMPMTTPSVKVDAVRQLGGEVVLHGETYDEACAEAIRRSADEGLCFIHPFDDPEVIAGQGTVGMEILRQCQEPPDAIYVAIGGGGLIGGIAAYVKSLWPGVEVIGVEPHDAAAMTLSLEAGERIRLPQVGLFADGVAVREVGENTFRLAQRYVDSIVTVSTDEICAAIKDVFEDTRSILEPAGALAIAGLKADVSKRQLQGRQLVAVACGANMNFNRLRFVAERAELGEEREAMLAVEIPEQPGSLRQLCELLEKRSLTEFSYRMRASDRAHIFMGVQIRDQQDRADLLASLRSNGYECLDLSDDELSKVHLRHMVGGRLPQQNKASEPSRQELLYRFEFPERPGALMRFVNALHSNWSISIFHYRNHGADVGRIVVGVLVSPDDLESWQAVLRDLGYPSWEETSNPAYRIFLGS
ncbi:threonine ammonia-lyase [Synechococcus sp. A18-25c]|uniref:threonine ammonia-lyase, biosynthetic n=1 Tax=unclassified Synechococcus TaxID=2626047 RepID=UPI0016467447|nr:MULTISPECIES: threonine ammonia-lyase, biosynthetic [unclassified Synechococcus]QNI48364.1 threonine ammonia-lyase [Synechococcus sp. A15-60]QNJ19990.1 threonine ammonia-lyase [Synechococcus sp. A18-25c]